VIMAYIPRASVFQKSKLTVREDEALRDLERITRAKDLIAHEEAQVARTLGGYRCSSTKPFLVGREAPLPPRTSVPRVTGFNPSS
jgi:hypothetical protein